MLTLTAPARSTVPASTPAPTTFEKAFDGGGEESGFSALQDADGNLLTLGNTSSFGAGFGDMYLQKTDSDGRSLWAKSYGGAASSEEGLHVAPTSDGGYVLAGRTYSFGAGNEDVYLVKIDRDGNLQWSKAYGTPKIERAYSVRQTSDGGYILAGTSLDYQNTPVDFIVNDFEVLLLKVTGAGDLDWARRYDAGLNEEGRDVEQTADGGYIVTGIALRDSSTQIDNVLLMKTDGSGAIEWANAYGDTAQAPGWTVRPLNGGYLVAGWANANGDCNMLKVDGGGAVQWDKTYGGPNNDLCYSAQATSDGGLLLAGSTGSFGAGSFDGYLVKTDGNGNLQWSRAYGGSNVEFGTIGFETSDGGYLLAGLTRSFSAAGDTYLVKTDGTGNSGCHDVAAATVVGVRSPQVTPLTFSVTVGGIATADAATQVATAPITENTLCASAPVQLIAAVSRKTHGSAGDFDVDLLGLATGIECRTGQPTTGDHTIVFTFAVPVTFATADCGGTTATASTSGDSVTVNCTGGPNAQTIPITIHGVSASGFSTSDIVVSMGVLIGDTTANGVVNSSDIGEAKGNSGQTTTGANFRTDVTANGTINSSDIGTVKANSGTSLP